MDTNTVSDDCTNGGDFTTGRSDFGSLGFSGPLEASSTSVPEPASLLLLLTSLIGLAAVMRARAQHSDR